MNDEIRTKLGSNIRQTREECGLSQKQLALMIGCGKAYISEVEAGLRNPTVETVGKFSKGLNTTLENLFRGI